MKKSIISIIVTLLIIGLCIIGIKPTINKISYGIDLQGGFEILYKIEPLKKDQELTQADKDNTYKAIVNRIDTLGVSEPVISFEGDNLIRIQLPGVSNEEEARKRISTTAVLSFRDTSDNLLMTSEVLGRNGASVSQNNKTFQYQVKLDIKDTETFYNVTNEVSKKSNDNNKLIIWLDFDELVDSYVSEKTICGKDGNMKCISDPYVGEALSSSDIVIEGSFTKEEAQELVDLINSGSLPTKLTEESTPRSVSASFGVNTINKTALAGLITFVLISLFLIIKYRISGLLGSVSLFVYLLLVFIIFNAVGGVLTLTGIAALILGIGMAVDSIIISNERIKDELLNGKKLLTAYKEGSKNSLGAIIDANITTLIAGIVLYIFGESSVRGFATMLIITIFVTIFATVMLYRFLQSLFIKTKWFNNSTKWFIGREKNIKNHDYVKMAKYPIIVSLSIIIIGIIFALVRGFNLGVDFTGGTNIVLSSSSILDFEVIKEVVKEYDIQGYDNYLGNEKEGYIKLNKILDSNEESKVKQELRTLGIETSVNEISNLVTTSLTKNAIKALVYSLLAIIIYVCIRFNMNYAFTGILMLVHDVLIILAIFAIFHIDVSFLIVASLLTIIGYSINDTIVVFDRIRYNRKKLYKNRKKLTNAELNDLVNISSSQTIVRNIYTSVTTIIASLTLLFVGLNDIFTFNISILVGLVAGSISSLLIGPKVWLLLEKRSINRPSDEDEEKEVEEMKVKGINY